MTIDEAKASLKALCHTCKHFPTCVNDKPECFQAIDMAIQSLEAWEKVKDEIKQKSDYTKNIWDEYPDEWYAGKCSAYGGALRIIDKHLLEVEHEADN